MASMTKLFTNRDRKDLDLVLSQCSPRFIAALFGNQIAGITASSDSMWALRANNLIETVLFALCDRRDRGDAELTVESLREHLSLDRVVELSKDVLLPKAAADRLQHYLGALPGYVTGATRFSDTAREQHAYLSMQITPLFSDLFD